MVSQKTKTELMEEIRGLRRENASLKSRLCLQQDSHELIKRLRSSTHVLMVGLDREGHVRLMNKGLELVTGYNREDLMGRSWFETLVPKDRYPLVHEMFSRHVQGETEDSIYKNPILTKSGEERIIVWQNYPYGPIGPIGPMGPMDSKAESQELTVLSIGVDVTESEQANNSLERFFALSGDLMSIGTLSHFQKVNDSFERVLGYTKEEISSRPLFDFVHPDDLEETIRQGEEKLRQGLPILQFRNRYICKDGSIRWIEWVAKPIPEEDLLYAVGRDIQAQVEMEQRLRESLREKDTLLREIHHRVKNNMNVIISLLALQCRQIDDLRVLRIFKEGQDRIRVMARLHEMLYRSGDFMSINAGEYLEGIVADIKDSFSVEAGNVLMRVVTGGDILTVDELIPCGLIVNELVTNSLKYAFPAGGEGSVEVRMDRENGNMSLSVADDGTGIPKEVDPLNTETLGLVIVGALARQLRGQIEVDRSVGTKITVDFPYGSNKEVSDG